MTTKEKREVAGGELLITSYKYFLKYSSSEIITEGNCLYFLKKQKYYFNLLEMLRKIVFHESSSFSKWTAVVGDHLSQLCATRKI